MSKKKKKKKKLELSDYTLEFSVKYEWEIEGKVTLQNPSYLTLAEFLYSCFSCSKVKTQSSGVFEKVRKGN